MQFNDVQKAILRNLRGAEDYRPVIGFEVDDLYEMLDVCEDNEIRFEILSMLKHADE